MKEAIIIGGGVSIREGIEQGLWEKIKGKDLWSCNYSAMFMPYLPSREIFVDRKFFQVNRQWLEELVKTVPVYCREHDIIVHSKFNCTTYDVSRLGYPGKKEMKKNRTLYSGAMGLSGFFAISLAIIEDYERVFILGYDFGTKDVKIKDTHWYQEKCKRDKHQAQTWFTTGKALWSTGVGNPSAYFNSDKNSPTFGQLKKDKDEISCFNTDIKIYNVSMSSNITCFEKITYQQMFNLLGV